MFASKEGKNHIHWVLVLLLIFAHRLGTIAKCDAILVLKDGVVAEQGSHDDLLKLGGEYASMWETQSKASQDVAYDETKEGL